MYPPWPACSISVFTAVRPFSTDLDAIMTRHPADANALTVSNPIPEFPPVTTATFPTRCLSLPPENLSTISFAVECRLPMVSKIFSRATDRLLSSAGQVACSYLQRSRVAYGVDAFVAGGETSLTINAVDDILYETEKNIDGDVLFLFLKKCVHWTRSWPFVSGFAIIFGIFRTESGIYENPKNIIRRTRGIIKKRYRGVCGIGPFFLLRKYFLVDTNACKSRVSNTVSPHILDRVRDDSSQPNRQSPR
jgi:hypothetical protein